MRRPDDVLRKLAADVVQGRAMVTDNERRIRSAFFLISAVFDWKGVDTEKVAAFIGYADNAVPGRAMNGSPIFLSMGFLHVDDVETYQAHLDRMEEALR